MLWELTPSLLGIPQRGNENLKKSAIKSVVEFLNQVNELGKSTEIMPFETKKKVLSKSYIKLTTQVISDIENRIGLWSNPNINLIAMKTKGVFTVVDCDTPEIDQMYLNAIKKTEGHRIFQRVKTSRGSHYYYPYTDKRPKTLEKVDIPTTVFIPGSYNPEATHEYEYDSFDISDETTTCEPLWEVIKDPSDKGMQSFKEIMNLSWSSERHQMSHRAVFRYMLENKTDKLPDKIKNQIIEKSMSDSLDKSFNQVKAQVEVNTSIKNINDKGLIKQEKSKVLSINAVRYPDLIVKEIKEVGILPNIYFDTFSQKYIRSKSLKLEDITKAKIDTSLESPSQVGDYIIHDSENKILFTVKTSKGENHKIPSDLPTAKYNIYKKIIKNNVNDIVKRVDLLKIYYESCYNKYKDDLTKDKEDELITKLIKYLRIYDNEYNRAVLTLFFAGLALRGVSLDGAYFPYMFVFTGPMGVGKDLLCKDTPPPLSKVFEYSLYNSFEVPRKLGAFASREFEEAHRGNQIVILSEGKLRGKIIDNIKKMTSDSEIKIRGAWGRAISVSQKRNIYTLTADIKDVLAADRDNRRFLPIHVWENNQEAEGVLRIEKRKKNALAMKEYLSKTIHLYHAFGFKKVKECRQSGGDISDIIKDEKVLEYWGQSYEENTFRGDSVTEALFEDLMRALYWKVFFEELMWISGKSQRKSEFLKNSSFFSASDLCIYIDGQMPNYYVTQIGDAQVPTSIMAHDPDGFEITSNSGVYKLFRTERVDLGDNTSKANRYVLNNSTLEKSIYGCSYISKYTGKKGLVEKGFLLCFLTVNLILE